jgi:hypothetical protein
LYGYRRDLYTGLLAQRLRDEGSDAFRRVCGGPIGCSGRRLTAGLEHGIDPACVHGPDAGVTQARLEQPLPGDRVGRPILVCGTANVFEARLVVDLVTPGGVLLARRNLLATAGIGTRGRFSTRISPPRSVARLVIVAYAHSPKNGARIDVTRIPVVTLAN